MITLAFAAKAVSVFAVAAIVDVVEPHSGNVCMIRLRPR